MKRILLVMTIICTIFLNTYVRKNTTLISLVPTGVEVVSYENCDDSELCVLSSTIDDVVDELDVKVVGVIDVGGSEIVEGYILSLTKYVISNDRKINVQLSFCDDVVIVGYPLIKKSF